jgi:hypothetical protein
VQFMSTNTLLPIVGGGGGADESVVVVCAGTEVPSTADVVGVGVGLVVTVVRGGGTAVVVPRADVDVDVEVDVDRSVEGLVTTVSTGVPDDADVGADESSPSLHPPTAAASRTTITTLDREIIRSIMSSWVFKVSAMRDNGARLAIANITIRTDSDSTRTGRGSQ